MVTAPYAEGASSGSAPPATGWYSLTVTVALSPAAVPALPSKTGALAFVVLPSAGLTMVTFGSVVSTVQVALAGVESSLPAPSMACTRKVCDPGARPE